MRLWLDTEFNGFEGPLISMALVSESRCEWNQVLGCDNPVAWVAENVMPVLKKRRTTLLRMQRSLAHWLARYTCIHVIANWPADLAHFSQVLLVGPSSRLVVPPLTLELVEDLEFSSKGPHNALADARALRSAHISRDRQNLTWPGKALTRR